MADCASSAERAPMERFQGKNDQTGQDECDGTMDREHTETSQGSHNGGHGEFKKLDFDWNHLDLETLILEDEGGESLVDSDEEDYRTHITISEWEEDTSDKKHDADFFSNSIRAWDEVTDSTGRHGDGVISNGRLANIKQSTGSESDSESWGSQRSLGLSDTSEGSDIFTVAPPTDLNTNVAGGIRVKIKRKHLRPLSGEPKEGQNCVNKQPHGLLLHPDMVYHSVAERVIEKYRIRANSDSSAKTARMTEHVETFRKSFIEKMAERRKSLPVNPIPRKLQPLDSPPELGKSSPKSQEFLNISQMEKPMLNSRSVGNLNMDPIQSQMPTSPKKDLPPLLSSPKALHEALSSKGLSPLNSPKTFKKGKSKFTRVASPSPPHSAPSLEPLGAQYNRSQRRKSDVLPLGSGKAGLPFLT